VITQYKIPSTVLSAIREAHRLTEINFGFLMAMCAQESAFVPDARPGINPKTGRRYSSALGLFQFLDATWAGMVKTYGKQYGIGLGDRTIPRASAIMGALFAKDNAAFLTRKGHKVGRTEMYIAHFLGMGGANDFLNAMARNSKASAAAANPSAAKANPSIYYKNGVPRSLSEVYMFFQGKIVPKADAFAAQYKAT
jgi:hypothetical protein